MFTDMVGYSDLTQRDEVGTLRLLNEHRQIVRPALAEFGGREIKTVGDAFMVEFADGLTAARCAVEIQRRHAERNRDVSLQEITIRIGLHAGEVIEQEGDLYGDTVNVASRIEPLSPPGGICLSEPVYEAAKSGLDIPMTPLGPATLKNIHLPIAVYRIDLRPERRVPTREGPWVNRDAELEQLDGSLEAAIEATGTVVFLAGEAGVGKTRLAERAIRAAARRGAYAVFGRASEEGSDAPYSLWIEAIRGLAAELSPAAWNRAVGDYAREIGELVPDLAPRSPQELPPAETDPDRARDRLFAAVVQLFRAVASEDPVVLLMDDIQWADSGSLRLLDAFGQRLDGSRVLVLASFRVDPEQSSTVLGEVVRSLMGSSHAVRIDVKRLDLDAVRQLVLLLVKTKAIPDAFVLQVFAKTHGNPYFVGEVIQSLRAQGILTGEPDRPLARLPESLPLPDTVRRVVRQRLELLDPELTRFLRAVAVLGREFPSRPLGSLTGLSEEPLVERLGEALSLGLLTESTDERGVVRYAFSDLGTWETIYGDTPASLRTRLHLRAGEALEALAEAGTTVPYSQLAYHFQQSRETGRALDYSLQAAEEASRLYAREEAVRHYRTALELLESRPDERLRPKLLEGLSEHLYRLGQLEVAQTMRRDAAERYERLGDHRAAGNLHRRIAHGMREDPAGARHHWEEALRLLGEGDESPELARLYNTIAGYHYEAAEARRAEELYGRAVDIARRVDDPTTQVAAQMVLAGLLPVTQGARVFEELEEALRVARAKELKDLVPNLCMVLAFAQLHMRGDAPGAERALAEGLATAREAQDVYSEKALQGNLATYLAWRLGQYERALREVAGHQEYAAGDPRKLLPVAFLVGADIELSRGDAERSGLLLDEADATLEIGGDWSERVQLGNLRGRTELLRGRPTRARTALATAHELATRMGIPALMAVLHAETLHLEVETELAAGAPEAGEGFLRQLVELDGSAGQAPIHGFATRARALRMHNAGERASSVEAFAESAGTWERLGWGYELARTRLLVAARYRELGEGERAEALEAAGSDFFRRFGGMPREPPPRSDR